MTRTQANALARNLGLPPLNPPPAAKGERLSGTERAYLAYLQSLLLSGAIAGYSEHEPCTIRLARVDRGRDVYYRPDFAVDRRMPCGCEQRVYVEVKGTKDGQPYYQTERGRLKPIWAAQRGWPVLLTWRVDGQWMEERL